MASGSGVGVGGGIWHCSLRDTSFHDAFLRESSAVSDLNSLLERQIVWKIYKFIIDAELGHFNSKTCLPYPIESHFDVKEDAGGGSTFLKVVFE